MHEKYNYIETVNERIYTQYLSLGTNTIFHSTYCRSWFDIYLCNWYNFNIA